MTMTVIEQGETRLDLSGIVQEPDRGDRLTSMVGGTGGASVSATLQISWLRVSADLNAVSGDASQGMYAVPVMVTDGYGALFSGTLKIIVKNLFTYAARDLWGEAASAAGGWAGISGHGRRRAAKAAVPSAMIVSMCLDGAFKGDGSWARRVALCLP